MDPLLFPVDESLSTVSTADLLSHRHLRFLSARSAYQVALTLALSYDRHSDVVMVWDDLALLYEAMEEVEEAQQCLVRAEEAGETLRGGSRGSGN